MAEFIEAGLSPQDIRDTDLVDGFSAEEIFENQRANLLGYTFDDLIVLPGHITFGVEDVDLRSKLTKRIHLNLPFCSSPMDTVTEHVMAIAIALQGGIGFLHSNNTISEQVEMVRRVKGFENGFIASPVVMSPTNTVEDLDRLKASKGISGVPITVDGKIGSRLVGLVTKRDVDFIENRSVTLQEVMVPAANLVVGHHPISLDQVHRIFLESKKGYLPIVDNEGNLTALTTRTDLRKNREFPLASKDPVTKRLLVGASVPVGDYDRAHQLIEAGADVLVLDAKNGDTDAQVEMVRSLKASHPNVELVGGNVVTRRQLVHLAEAGVDAIRVGMGAASVSTTQEIKAVGRAQLSTIFHTARIARQYGIPVIADGGIGSPGSASKALALGASVVMMGSLLAGVEESPGEYFFQDGMRLKRYRGTASVDSIRKTRTSNGEQDPSVAVGVSGAVSDRGPMDRFIPYMAQSLRHGLQDMGVSSLSQLWEFTFAGRLRFEIRSACAQREGGVHDLFSYQKTLYA